MSLIDKLVKQRRTSDQSNKWLELKSQSQLLEQLRGCLQFGSSLVVLSGKTGSGKTVLGQRFHLEFTSVNHSAIVQCHPGDSEQDIRAQILEQLLPEYCSDASLSLYENLDQAFGLENHRLQIVLDDAGLAPASLLSELWGLVERLTAHPTLTLHLIFITGPELKLEKLTPLCASFNVQPRVMTIPPLSNQDRDLFLDLLVLRRFESIKKRNQLRKRAHKMKAYPGLLNELGTEVKPTKKTPHGSRGSAKNGLLALAVVAVLGLLLWWWMSDGSGSKQQVSDQVSSQAGNEFELEMKQGDGSEPGDMQLAERDTLQQDDAALPPPVTEETATVGDNGNGRQRVVVPDEVLDSLIDNEQAVAKPQKQVKPAEPAISFPLLEMSY
ncbi:damX protein [Vibrio ishigakensis]|uniref:DamX protein n=1 Tax=Vibrio ishigakensis TaxID=1481914 RepID=A0A0B8QC08_9VIBR|nr:damX protein [Vibrio ishigakensis]